MEIILKAMDDQKLDALAYPRSSEDPRELAIRKTARTASSALPRDSRHHHACGFYSGRIAIALSSSAARSTTPSCLLCL